MYLILILLSRVVNIVSTQISTLTFRHSKNYITYMYEIMFFIINTVEIMPMTLENNIYDIIHINFSSVL